MGRTHRRHVVEGIGFWVHAGIPHGRRAHTFVECGSCGCFHRTDFYGDSRNDDERYDEIPDGGEEVFEDLEDQR